MASSPAVSDHRNNGIPEQHGGAKSWKVYPLLCPPMSSPCTSGEPPPCLACMTGPSLTFPAVSQAAPATLNSSQFLKQDMLFPASMSSHGPSAYSHVSLAWAEFCLPKKIDRWHMETQFTFRYCLLKECLYSEVAAVKTGKWNTKLLLVV